MKKLILLTGTALILAGCNRGGTGDDYDTGVGTDSSGSTNYNYQPDQGGTTPDSGTNDMGGMGGAESATGTNTGSGAGVGETGTGDTTTP
jgi:hypothetical protein